MSAGVKMRHQDAMHLAAKISEELAPVVVRSKAVGSLRRRREFVSDIEFLIEPRMLEADLFGTPAADVAPIRAVAEQLGEIVRGGERYIQVRHVLGSPLNLDLFICHPPAEWGVLHAIRTGPASLAELAVTRMHQFRRHCSNGHITDKVTGALWPCPEEEDFFAAAGLPCLRPYERDRPTAYVPIEISREVAR